MTSINTGSQRTNAMALVAIGVFLVWHIITGSVAAYLATEAPLAALKLDSREPMALVTLADKQLNSQSMREVAKSAGVAPEVADDKVDALPVASDRLRGWAEVAIKGVIKGTIRNETGRPDDTSVQLKHVADLLTETERNLVRSRAELALTHDPFNARALRILGQLADSADNDVVASRLMQAAANRSLRERYAVYWLIQKSSENSNTNAVLHYTDALIRASPSFLKYAMPILVQLVESEESDAKDAVKTLIASNPPWRPSFFRSLPDYVTKANTPLDLLLRLKSSTTPPTAADLKNYLRRLIDQKYFELAYYTWLQFLPAEQLNSIENLFNSSFETPPSGVPFDWVIPERTSGVTIEIISRADRSGESALRFEFGPGRANFPGVAQLLLLPPGVYQFNGTYRGELKGIRGLQWRITCAGRKGMPIGEGDMFLGLAPTWRNLEFTFTVPDSDCRAQDLRLVLAARSSSEKLVSGAVWYDELRIKRIEQPAQLQKTERIAPGNH